MELSWGWRRHQQTERNRVRAGNGDVLEWDAMFGEYSGPDAPAPRPPLLMASPAPGETNAIRLYLRLRTLSLDVDGSCCPVHGGLITVTATGTNVAPPYVWSVDGRVQEETGPVLGIDSIPDPGVLVTCQTSDDPITYSSISVGCMVYIEAMRCRESSTNIVGAAWTSTHNPTNATDHLPGVTTNISQNLGVCPPSTNIVYRVGWTHDELILHIRNLVRILTGDPMGDETDHCIGLSWTDGMAIDLASYLDGEAFAVIDRLRFTVNGAVVARNFAVTGSPGVRSPVILHVKVFADGVSRALDNLWITVYTPTDSTEFNAWYTIESTNTAWTAGVPTPPSSLVISGGLATTGTGGTGNWAGPDRIPSNSYLHHDAVFEMRTNESAAEGNQATYDADGHLITNGIMAGTADRFAPYNSWGVPTRAIAHRDNDVYPYICALQLDGNPVIPTSDFSPKKLTRPALYQGTNVQMYLECRPTVY